MAIRVLPMVRMGCEEGVGDSFFPAEWVINSFLKKLTGWYWIDPNLGMIDDAIYVFCNLTAQGETCVFPDVHTSQMQNIPWRRENDRTDWYSNLRGGFQVRNNFPLLFFLNPNTFGKVLTPSNIDPVPIFFL